MLSLFPKNFICTLEILNFTIIEICRIHRLRDFAKIRTPFHKVPACAARRANYILDSYMIHEKLVLFGHTFVYSRRCAAVSDFYTHPPYILNYGFKHENKFFRFRLGNGKTVQQLRID